MVLEEGKTQKHASEKVKIKLETAKLIIRKYRRTGTVFQKKMPTKRQSDDKKS